MSDGNTFDIDALIPWLEENIEDFSGFQGLDKFGTGQSNPTYRIDAASGTYVLRAKPPGELLKSAHAVDREFRVQRALAETGVPVPDMLALCQDDSLLGTDFYIMQHLSQRILPQHQQ